jgi:F0F1-type ATP synthase assembly protein I
MVGDLNPREMGRYVAMAQVGMEMVAPVGLGLLLDYYFGTMPWITVIGAVLGLVGGLAHLVRLSNRVDEGEASKPGRDAK